MTDTPDSTYARRVAALSAAAKAWTDPDYAPRAEAVAATLDAPNRFTEEALAFAINQHMHQLASPKKLRAWGAAHAPAEAAPVGIVTTHEVPLDAVRAVAAAWLMGHVPTVLLAEGSPYLLRAFAEDVAGRQAGLLTTFAHDADTLLAQVDALVVRGDADAQADWTARAEGAGLAADRVHAEAASLTVALVDGTEDFDARIGLAEDVLLHEGLSPRSVALLWAPAGLDPDPYFEAFSGFRQVMPAHEDTEGVLEMPRAFLDAADQPYAWGDGVLVSRGEPDVQTAGHLRWVDVEAPSGAADWLAAHEGELRGVVATDAVAERFGVPERLRVAPGDAHRRRLGDEEDARLVAFLAGL